MTLPLPGKHVFSPFTDGKTDYQFHDFIIYIIPHDYPKAFEVRATEDSGNIEDVLPRTLGFQNKTEGWCEWSTCVQTH